ncbi:MAG: hypothetical protein LAP87_28030 [Acidobacteriia bacterium]|nr:hypothetical protein [Terriglobia bacterium]
MPPPDYDVFLSFHHSNPDRSLTRDYEIAHQVFKYLDDRHVRVYFFPEPRDNDDPSFQARMNSALETARVLVLVGTSRAHVTQSWVTMEWSYFDGQLRKDRKPGGALYTYIENMAAEELPPSLATYDSFQHQPGESPSSLEKLYRRIMKFPSLLPGEWAVSEAATHKFLATMRNLYDLVGRGNSGPMAELAITLYTKSTDQRQQGVDRFEYDLIYHRNLRDDAPMFGPVVQSDVRTQLAAYSGHMWHRPYEESNRVGFAARECLSWSAGYHLRNSGELAGLLFISGRVNDAPFRALSPQDDSLAHRLAEIASSLPEIRQERLDAFNKRLGEIVTGLPTLPGGAPGAINTFFHSFTDRIQRATNGLDVVFSAYLYSEDRKSLEWVWSNSFTGAAATLPLPGAQTCEPLLIAEVANDRYHKPLLVHDIPGKPEYKHRIVRTRLGDQCRSNLALPVLAVPARDKGGQLLGVLDIQARYPEGAAQEAKQAPLDTNDVQLYYELSRLCLSPAMETIHKYAAAGGALPLRESTPYAPFQRRPLGVNVSDMLELDFNPMKFLLHWEAVRELIENGTTQRPSTVEVWPSMTCNHNCAWCRTRHQQLGQGGHKVMAQSALQSLAQDLIGMRGVDILISGGGEPLWGGDERDYPSWIGTFIEAISAGDGTIGIFTNGTRPADFRFWESFFKRQDRHRFVRISFNGHNPECYFRVHSGPYSVRHLPSDYAESYAEARKTVMDLLGVRSPLGSVAIGDTVLRDQLDDLEKKAEHARSMGVDFIQIRPELVQSSQNSGVGVAICDKVREVAGRYPDGDFRVIATDGERSFVPHDEPRCFVMQLVPTLVADPEEGWIRVMPCSYAINMLSKGPPNLGRMREGASLTGFWGLMNAALSPKPAMAAAAPGGDSAKYATSPSDSRYEVQISAPIDPRTAHCPQCRYYRLNKRIQAVADSGVQGLELIDDLVSCLRKDPNGLAAGLRHRIEETWPGDGGERLIDVRAAIRAFGKSKELGIVPSF